MQRWLMCAVMGLAVAGCATAPVQRQFERQATVPVQFDAAWNALIDIFGERGWTIANMEKVSGFINSDWMSATGAARRYYDCGSPGIAIESGHRGRFNVVVRPTADSAAVTIAVNSTFGAVRDFAGTILQVECLSTGELEQEVHEQVLTRAGPGG